MSSLLFKAMSNSVGNMSTNMMIQALQRNNPQAYNQLQSIMASGNQNQAINQMLSQANPQQISQLRMMAKQFGLNDSDINKFIK